MHANAAGFQCSSKIWMNRIKAICHRICLECPNVYCLLCDLFGLLRLYLSRCWSSKVRKCFLDATAAISITNKQTNRHEYCVCVCLQEPVCRSSLLPVRYSNNNNNMNSLTYHEQASERTNVHKPIHIICNMLNGIYKETNACYIYDLFILCCNFRARQPNYAKRTCFSVAYIQIHSYSRSLYWRVDVSSYW